MSAVSLGSFQVAAAPDEVAAFRRAARLEGEALPFTYPIRWLVLPQVRAGMMALMSEPGLVPFHESQTFDYARPLRVGATYTLTVAARRESAPDRLVVEATVSGEDGARETTIETVLRLFSTEQSA